MSGPAATLARMNDRADGSSQRPESVGTVVTRPLEGGAAGLLCPRCGATGQRPIVYGLPTWEADLQAQRGEVERGGCFVMPADTACPACGLEWESEKSRAPEEGMMDLEVTRFDHDDEGYVHWIEDHPAGSSSTASWRPRCGTSCCTGGTAYTSA